MMITGKKITLGGKEFEAPPAPFSVMRKYADVFSGEGKADTFMMSDVVFCALRRNYPDLTQDEFEEKYLDVSNMREAFNAVMNISGAEARAPGEAQPGNL